VWVCGCVVCGYMCVWLCLCQCVQVCVDVSVWRGRYGALMGRGDTSLRPWATSLFSALPVLSPGCLRHPCQLVAAGLWTSVPAGWEDMSAAPRYIAGQQVRTG
jgi:hypothetical protein